MQIVSIYQKLEMTFSQQYKCCTSQWMVSVTKVVLDIQLGYFYG
jgi:hypothetical protein